MQSVRPSPEFRRQTPSLPARLSVGIVTLLAAAAVWAASPPTAAIDATLSLDELMDVPVDTVFSASRYLQKVTQAPSSVSIVTAEDIRRFGYRTLPEVLNSVRGLYIASDRNYSYLGVRGFLRPNDYNTRVLVLIDGHRINDNLYDSGTLAREGMIDVESIERVEVIRGTTSSLYGSSAFFGVVNVITRRIAGETNAQVSVDMGSFGARRARASASGALDTGTRMFLSASRYDSDGPSRLYYPEFDQRISDGPRAGSDGIARDLDAEQASNLFGRVEYRDFTLAAFLNRRTKQVPTASFGSLFNDPDEQTRDRRAYLDLGYERELGDRSRLQARVTWDRLRYDGLYPTDYAQPGDPVLRVLFRDGAVGEWMSTEMQFDTLLRNRHHVVLGTEYRHSLRELQFGFGDTTPRLDAFEQNTSASTLGVYAQTESRLSDRLLLSAGLRFDHYSDGRDGTLNPRVGLIYSATENASFKALYGEAFRAPNPYELHYYEAQLDQAELRPETIRTCELTYEQSLGSRYRLSVSAYSNRVNSLISQAATTDGELFFANLESARARGVEFDIEGRFSRGLTARMSYALHHTHDGGTGEELSSSPGSLAKLNLGLPLAGERLTLGLELLYQDDALTPRGNRAGDALLSNATLTSRVRGFDLSASVYNLLDRRYVHPVGVDHAQDVIEQDGRTFRLMITKGFR